jgi:uridine kinase
MKPAQLLGVLAEQLEGRSKRRPLRVGIDGRSSAGKTTLADALADRLEARARECLRASLDDFHHPGHEQREKAGGLTPAEYLRDGYDYAKIRELLLDPLGPNGSRRCRLDFWNSHADEPFPEDWVEAKPDAIVLVDGMFLHTPPLRDLWDFTIWVDVDWERMLLRGAHRDGTPGGPADLVREAHRTGWIARQRWYEETVHPQELADVVIDNSDVERPNLVRAPRPTRMVP